MEPRDVRADTGYGSMIRDRAWLTFPPLWVFESFSISRRGRGTAGGWRRAATRVTSCLRPDDSSREKYRRLAARSTSAVNSRGMGVPGGARRVRGTSDHPAPRGAVSPDREGRNAAREEEEDRPRSRRGRLNKITHLHRCWAPPWSRISGEAPYFFSPPRYSGRTRTVRGRVTHVELARLF